MKTELITNPAVSAAQPHKFLSTIGMLWMAFSIMAAITAMKTFSLWSIEYTVAIIAYPITYIFADIFTEVYGYRVTRKIVWTGFIGLIVVSVLGYLYSIIPSSPNFHDNAAFSLVFKAAPGLAVAQLMAFFGGELTNSFILAKMKIWFKGKLPEARYITSTLFGQIVDNSIFFTVAYLLTGFFGKDLLGTLIVSSVLFCTLVEMVMIPITRLVIKKIKHIEGIDTFDHGTNFNPFKIKQ